MGDYSELYFSNARTPPGRGELSEASPYLLSKYHVPLFWFALFSPEDISEHKESDEPDDVWPYLSKRRVRAMDMFNARRAALMIHFPQIAPLWADQFAALLAQTHFEYVHLDTRQIGGMIHTGPKWRQALETMLDIFESAPPPAPVPRSFLGRLFRTPEPPGSPGWYLFKTHFSGSYAGTRGAEPWPYCGSSGTDNPMPWEPQQ